MFVSLKRFVCVNSSHHQHCKTKLSKVLVPDRLLFSSVVHTYAMKTTIHHGNKENSVYSQYKHLVCHSAPLWSIIPVITTAAQGSVLCLILLNVFINELDDGTMFILTKFSKVAKLGGMTDRPQGCHSQSDLERKKKWAHTSFMKFNKLKFKVSLPLGKNHPRHQHVLGPSIWKAALQKGSWGQKVEHEPFLCCFS